MLVYWLVGWLVGRLRRGTEPQGRPLQLCRHGPGSASLDARHAQRLLGHVITWKRDKDEIKMVSPVSFKILFLVEMAWLCSNVSFFPFWSWDW